MSDLRVMPDHNVPDEDVVCRGAVKPGYVFVLTDGKLHCNRCGWITDAPAITKVPREVRQASNEGLLKSYAVLTHRLHVADRNPRQQTLANDLRNQRDILQNEILKRMS